MKPWAWVLLGLGITVAQTTLVPYWRIGPVAPDLLLGCVILLAVYGEGEEIFLFGPALGYLRDLYSAAVPGTSVLLFALLVWFIKFEKTVLDFDSYLLDMMVAGAVLADGLLSLGLQRMALAGGTDWTPALILLCGRAAYTVLGVEAARFLWRSVVQKRLAATHPERRRFHELQTRPPAH